MTLQVERLGDHQLDDFRCGKPELDTWLIDRAASATGHGTRTYLVVGEDRVVGYFALVPHLVAGSDLPARIGRGGSTQIPTILLAKLALDISVQGTGLGKELLILALEKILEAARVAGGRLVMVDAIDETAARFYEHHSFVRTPGDPSRLVMKLSTAAKALGQPWP